MNKFVGNDIVDLNTRDAKEFPLNPRYLKKALREDELIYLENIQSNSTTFWFLWAAKEAVYKVVKKEDQHALFSHKLFKVENLKIESEIPTAIVTYSLKKYYVEFKFNQEWVHCTCLPIEPNGKVYSIIKHQAEIECHNEYFNAEERKSIKTEESLKVRCLLKKTLKDLTGYQYEIRRISQLREFGPPELWMNGKPIQDFDISLSHDGNYCAVTIFQHSHLKI